jgi:hypothetical protein
MAGILMIKANLLYFDKAFITKPTSLSKVGQEYYRSRHPDFYSMPGLNLAKSLMVGQTM